MEQIRENKNVNPELMSVRPKPENLTKHVS